MQGQADTQMIKEKVVQMQAVLQRLAPFQHVIPRQYEELASHMDCIGKDVQAAMVQGRKLRIAVVGQVKAGKSSFLNAVLFGGNGVLPKAATPMTAALTMIRYAPETKAEVEFYDAADWEKIVHADEKYQEFCETVKERLLAERAAVKKGAGLFAQRASAELRQEDILAVVNSEAPHDQKAAHELVVMAQKNALDVERYLGSRQVIEGVASPMDLMDKLQNFVGAEGKFTPIVRNSIIYYDDPALAEVEIIDTPGINDPVISRGRRTKEMLGQCDVVFVLSQCSQFLDAVDMELLVQNLPAKGIKNIVLVASQLDAVLPGESNKYANIQQLLQGVVHKIGKRAASTVEDLLKQSSNETERDILQQLKSALPPIFISSMAFNMAQHFDHMDKEERHFYGLYNSMYSGLVFEKNLLLELSCLPRITGVLEAQKQKKEEILSGRLQELIKGAETGFSLQMEELRKTIGSQIARLQNEDVESLQEKEKQIVGRINKGRGSVDGAFENAIIKMQRDFELLKTEIKGVSSDFSSVREQTETYTKTYSVSTSKWYKPWTWGSSETRTRTITSRYANVHESIDQVEQFVYETERRLKQAIISIVDLPRLKTQMREGAMNLFDLGDSSFDADDILRPIERAVNRITVPSVEFGDRDYSSLITKNFSSGRVEESQISSLREAQRAALKAVIADMEKVVRGKTDEMVHSLERSQKEFVDSLLKDIQDDLAQLREQLKNKEAALQTYKEMLGVVKEAQN